MLNIETAILEFSALDRCDSCGAQAYTMARREDMPVELLFCLHHRKIHYDNLLDEGWEVIDDYEAISRLADNQIYV